MREAFESGFVLLVCFAVFVVVIAVDWLRRPGPGGDPSGDARCKHELDRHTEEGR